MDVDTDPLIVIPAPVGPCTPIDPGGPGGPDCNTKLKYASDVVPVLVTATVFVLTLTVPTLIVAARPPPDIANPPTVTPSLYRRLGATPGVSGCA